MLNKTLSNNTVPRARSKQLSINVNKEGTVRNINGKVYVDFLYLGQRVREPSGLPWSGDNPKLVRTQLDRIALGIRDGSFQFRKVFPNSKKVDYFSKLETKLLHRTSQPNDVFFKDYAAEWYETTKSTGRIRERTLLGYKSLIRLYLNPFFGDSPFGAINAATIDSFTGWARKQEFRNKPASNATINKSLVPLQMICNRAAIQYGWGASYNPFFGYQKLEEENTREKIEPFSLDEQARIISDMSDHWKLYFRFAFCSGLRSGEQISLRVEQEFRR